MVRYKLFVWAFILTSVFASCDLSIPDKPDFRTAQTVEVPLINNKTYVFLGDSTGALIDTTSGLISITTEEEFNFGSLDDAIPEIDGSSTSFTSEVGELEIGNFASGDGGNLGEADFQALTGLDPNSINQGDDVPPQAIQPEVDINLDTDLFQSADFKSGSLEIIVTNNLGFILDNINVTLISDPDTLINGDEVDVVTGTSNTINDGESATISLPLDGETLANPQVRVSIEWTSPFANPQKFQRSPESLVVNSASGSDLFASSVTANLESQDFSTSSTTTFSDTEFRFTSPTHYVELSAGQIAVTDLVNNMGIGIETLQISFPDIRNDNFGVEDSLVVSYPVIPRNSTATDQTIDLTGYRIFANNNEVTYNIVAATENTQTGPNAGPVTISETDEITASVDISGLTIKSAQGIVLAQTVFLGDNDLSNDGVSEILDVFNDNEADTTSIDGLDEFSDQIDGFMFTNPVININYNSNIDIPTTIYAAMVGIDGKGNEVYLKGEPGSANEVQDGDPIDGLYANGAQLPKESLIKFSIGTETINCATITCQIPFNTTTTNVDDFLNNLPSNIRFVGRAVVNEDEGDVFITTPLEFNPSLNVDLPLAFSTEVGSPANFTDTLDLDIGLGDDFTEASFFITYSNNLPMGLNIFLSFQDSLNNEVFALPNADQEIRLRAAPVDDVTGFSNASTDDSFLFTLSELQLGMLNDVSFLEFSINLRSSENKAVKLRANDSFTISLGARIKIETEVKGK